MDRYMKITDDGLWIIDHTHKYIHTSIQPTLFFYFHPFSMYDKH